MSGWVRAAVAAIVAVAAGGPAAAQTVIEGRSAQALRCAVYVGMAGQYGHAEGLVTKADLDLITTWSVQVLEVWVPGDPPGKLAAYRAAMGELGAAERPYAVIARHADWCMAEFTPRL